jgi:hypothetical protein
MTAPPGRGAALRVPARVHGKNKPPGRGVNRPPGSKTPPGGTPVWTPSLSGGIPKPDPLPPAPLFSPVSLLVLGGVSLVQWLWGLLNGRGTERPYNPAADQFPTLTFATGKRVQFTRKGQGFESSSDCNTGAGYRWDGYTATLVDESNVVGFTIESEGLAPFECGDFSKKDVGGATLVKYADGRTVRTSPNLRKQISDYGGRQGYLKFRYWVEDLRVNGAAYPVGVQQDRGGVAGSVPIGVAALPALQLPPPKKVVGAAAAGAEPVTEPEPEGERLPQPVKPPVPVIAPPVTVPGGVSMVNGTQPAPKPSPVPVTPADVVFPWPGSGPVGGPGQKPQETIQGIAQEVGKIERKLEIAFSPPKDKPGSNMSWDDWWDAINRIKQLLTAAADKSGYEISSGCLPDDEPGGRNKPLRREWDGSWAFDGMILNRLDAIAGLLQDSKDLKQPICEEPEPAPVGRNISIQFRSDRPSPYGKERLRKEFRYRDPSLKDLAEHVEHWKDYEWESGPWMVISEGLPWGKPQVWAKSEEEGRRVLTHAAQIAGVDLSSSSHRWRVHEAVGYRERPVMRMRVHRDVHGRLWIAERTSAEGLPMVLGQGPSDPGVEG